MPNESGRQPALHKKHVARLERERQQTKWILYVAIGILVMVALLIGYGYLDVNYLQLRKPVAKVGETEITLREFQSRVRLQRQNLLMQANQVENLYYQYEQFAQSTGMDLSQQMQQFAGQLQQIQAQLDSTETIGQAVLDQMIKEEIIRQEAAKRGITASQAEIDQLKEEMFQYYPDGTPTATATATEANTPEIPAEAFDIVTITPTPLEFTLTPEFTATATATIIMPTVTGTIEPTLILEPTATLTATLAPTATATEAPTSTPEATSTPEPTSTPYTLDSFNQDYGDAVYRMTRLGFDEKIYDALFETQVLERKLKDAIAADVKPEGEQLWARHILVPDQALALSLIGKIQSGEDFGALAKEFSTDTGSGANGGDLGWFGKGVMVADFETAAFALEKPGDITTAPIQSQFGFHIIQLIAKQPRPLSAEQFETAREQSFTDWYEKVKAEYAVETFDLWKTNVPTDPDLAALATESSYAQQTAAAREKESDKEATATPK